MKCASALSKVRESEAALREVVEGLRAGLEGATADIAFVFATANHADALGKLAATIRSEGLARHVLGCTGESIVRDGEEVEESAAISVWAGVFPGVRVESVRLSYDEGEIQGAVPETPGATLMLLGDPFSFPIDHLLKELRASHPGLAVLGGMASGSPMPGGNTLLLDQGVFDTGAVGLLLDGGIAIRSVVSQGCRPVGRTFIVTKAERNILRELGRRPAIEVLREMFDELPPSDQELVQQGLHIGRVINEYQEAFQKGDFLVRNVLGADDAGGIAVSDLIRVGQTVQFHVRDANSAHADLLGLLESSRSARPGEKVVGALLFSCNGRGTRLFPGPNHDAGLIRRILGPIPTAGFFAMGEIGPVGGQNFVHGYTASLALFVEAASADAAS